MNMNPKLSINVPVFKLLLMKLIVWHINAVGVRLLSIYKAKMQQ